MMKIDDSDFTPGSAISEEIENRIAEILRDSPPDGLSVDELLAFEGALRALLRSGPDALTGGEKALLSASSAAESLLEEEQETRLKEAGAIDDEEEYAPLQLPYQDEDSSSPSIEDEVADGVEPIGDPALDESKKLADEYNAEIEDRCEKAKKAEMDTIAFKERIFEQLAETKKAGEKWAALRAMASDVLPNGPEYEEIRQTILLSSERRAELLRIKESIETRILDHDSFSISRLDQRNQVRQMLNELPKIDIRIFEKFLDGAKAISCDEQRHQDLCDKLAASEAALPLIYPELQKASNKFSASSANAAAKKTGLLATLSANAPGTNAHEKAKKRLATIVLIQAKREETYFKEKERATTLDATHKDMLEEQEKLTKKLMQQLKDLDAIKKLLAIQEENVRACLARQNEDFKDLSQRYIHAPELFPQESHVAANSMLSTLKRQRELASQSSSPSARSKPGL